VKTKLDLILNLPNPSQSPDRLENAITKITVLKDLHSLDQNLQVPKRSFICSTNLEARASISKFANWSKESFFRSQCSRRRVARFFLVRTFQIGEKYNK
jgi:hypothetical protein